MVIYLDQSTALETLYELHLTSPGQIFYQECFLVLLDSASSNLSRLLRDSSALRFGVCLEV